MTYKRYVPPTFSEKGGVAEAMTHPDLHRGFGIKDFETLYAAYKAKRLPLTSFAYLLNISVSTLRRTWLPDYEATIGEATNGSI